MGEDDSKYDIKDEAEWIESTLTKILIKDTTQIKVTARSRRWWTLEVEAKRKKYRGTRRLNRQRRVKVFTLKVEQNSYYQTIRRTKRIYRAAFLQGSDEIHG